MGEDRTANGEWGERKNREEKSNREKEKHVPQHKVRRPSVTEQVFPELPDGRSVGRQLHSQSHQPWGPSDSNRGVCVQRDVSPRRKRTRLQPGDPQLGQKQRVVSTLQTAHHKIET